jgi:hypothetical protein
MIKPMAEQIFSRPIIGWGNRNKCDTESTLTLSLPQDNSALKCVATPVLENPEWETHLWWTESLSQIGIASGDASICWNPAGMVGYVFDIGYPTEYKGSCGFAALPRELKRYERPDQFYVFRMPYSSASLEKLLALSSALSQLSLGPTRTIQWSDSRF